MRARNDLHFRFSRVVFALLALTSFSPPALAQPAPDVELSPVEISLGLTINGLAQDANARPHCVDLSLPCTDKSPREAGGFGLALSVTRNLSDRVAIAGDLSTFVNEWDSWESLRANRRAVDHVTFVLIGPKVNTGFFYPGNGDPEPGRFFAQVLVGAAASDVVPLRPALQIGGGVEFIVPRGWSRGVARGPSHDTTFRMEIDYRVASGADRSLSGWRYVFGIVFGPRLSGS